MIAGTHPLKEYGGLTTYEIVVFGELDESWSGWFGGMKISVCLSEAGRPVTCLSGPLADQAMLRGILSHIWDLNLVILSVKMTGTKPVPQLDEPEKGSS